MISIPKRVKYKIEKMELIKVKCYECGSEYPVPADMPTCHCRECRSGFVENVPLARIPVTTYKNPDPNKSLYVNHQGLLYERDCSNPYSRNPSSPFRHTRINFDEKVKREIFSENSEKSEKCNICLEAINHGDQITRLDNCKHIYHYDCIMQWVRVKNSCPTCTKIAFN